MAIPKSAIKFYNSQGTQIVGGIGTSGMNVTPKVIFPFQETVTNETINAPFTGRLDLVAPAFSFDCIAENPPGSETDLLSVKLPGQGLQGSLYNANWVGTGTPSINGNEVEVPKDAGTLFLYCYSNSPTLGMYKTDPNITLDTEVDIETGQIMYLEDADTDIAVNASNGTSDLGAVRKYSFLANVTFPQNTSGTILDRGTLVITTNQNTIFTITLSQSN